MAAPPSEPVASNSPAIARDGPDWWAAPGVLQRFVADLVADEVAHLRPGGAALPPRPCSADLRLDCDGLGLDSLELLSVAAALNETLHLHESGIEDLLVARRSVGDWVALADEGLQHFSARCASRLMARWPHPVQDRIEWLADSQFRVAGRLDAAVHVGGVNVFPERVRQALLTHRAVRQAAVRPMAAHEGQRLKAFIVPAPGADPAALRDEMTRWLSGRLSAPEQPKAFTFGTALPVSHRGKACDWPISCGEADLKRTALRNDSSMA